MHSLPKFPRPAKEGYTWPHNGLTYGQAFICVTYPYATLNAIGMCMIIMMVIIMMMMMIMIIIMMIIIIIIIIIIIMMMIVIIMII